MQARSPAHAADQPLISALKQEASMLLQGLVRLDTHPKTKLLPSIPLQVCSPAFPISRSDDTVQVVLRGLAVDGAELMRTQLARRFRA